VKLLPEGKDGLDSFIGEIRHGFPGTLERVMVFGSKAREDANHDSDLDVLVVLKGKEDLKSRIRLLGYELALGKDVVPSIVVYTVQEVEQRREHRSEQRREHRSVFVEAVEREGVVVS